MSYASQTQGPLIPNRPLLVGDILQATFTLYRHGFLTIVLTALLPSVVMVLIVLVGMVVVVAPLLPILMNLDHLNPLSMMEAVMGSVLLAFAVILVGNLLIIITQYWAGATVASAIAELDRGGRPDLRTLWRSNRGLFGRCAGLAGILLGFSVGIGLLTAIGIFVAVSSRGAMAFGMWSLGALVVGALIVSGRLALTMPVLGIERLGPWDALKRSWQLTEGHVWRVVGITLLVGVLIMLGQQVIGQVIGNSLMPLADQLATYSPGQDVSSVVLAALPMLLLSTGLNLVYSVVTTPLGWMVNTVLYFDLSRRSLGGPGQQAATGRPIFGHGG